MSNNDQDANTNENSGELNDQNVKASSDEQKAVPDIFSLDSIDDSWLDDKDEFSPKDKLARPKVPGQNTQLPVEGNSLAKGQSVNNSQDTANSSQLPQSSLDHRPIQPTSKPVLPGGQYQPMESSPISKPPEEELPTPLVGQMESVSSDQSVALPNNTKPPPPPLPTNPGLPELNNASNQHSFRDPNLDTSDNLPSPKNASSVQKSNLAPLQTPNVIGPKTEPEAIDSKAMVEPAVRPGVPKQGVIPAKEVHTLGESAQGQKASDNALISASAKGYHGWVQNRDHMRTHGDYRKLGDYSPALANVLPVPDQLVPNVAEQEKDKLVSPMANSSLKVSEAVLNEVPGPQGEKTADSEEKFAPSPLTEDLLSGNFKTPLSNKIREPIYHEVGQPPKPPDGDLSISQMLKRDFQGDPLIDGNLDKNFSHTDSLRPDSIGDPQQKVKDNTGSQSQNDISILKSKAPGDLVDLVKADNLLPQGQKSSSIKSITEPLKQSPMPHSFVKSNSQTELDSKPDSSSSNSSHLSRKDFSKSDSSSKLPFRLIVGAVILIGIVIGAGIYQFRDSIGGNDTKGEKIVSTQKLNSASLPESQKASRPKFKRVENWQRDFDKGLKYLGEKDYEKAIVYLSTSIAENDIHPEVYHSRGRAYSKTKNYSLAVNDFTEALKISGRNEDILLDRAAAYVYSDELKKALSDYSKILVINPTNSKASYGRGLVYVKLHNYDKALSDFETTISADPYYVNGYLRIGMIYAGQDKNEEAIESFSKALKYKKRDDIYYERALSYYAINKLDEAIADFTEAIALKSGRKDYYNDRGYVYLKMGKSKNAKKDFESALNIDPQYKLAKQNLAKVSEP